MKKIGSSFKNLGAIFLGLILLFLLFSMFSGSREGFASCGCTIGTCTSSNKDQKCNGAGNYAHIAYKCKEYTQNGKTRYSWSSTGVTC